MHLCVVIVVLDPIWVYILIDATTVRIDIPFHEPTKVFYIMEYVLWIITHCGSVSFLVSVVGRELAVG